MFRRLIDEARSLGGTYYLPYYAFAERGQFESHYGRDGALAAFRSVLRRYDPDRKFWNRFLQDYIG